MWDKGLAARGWERTGEGGREVGKNMPEYWEHHLGELGGGGIKNHGGGGGSVVQRGRRGVHAVVGGEGAIHGKEKLRKVEKYKWARERLKSYESNIPLKGGKGPRGRFGKKRSWRGMLTGHTRKFDKLQKM